MKKLLFTCVFFIFILFSLLYPAQIIDASKQGILIWFEQILPALLPFTILSTLLLKSNLLKSFSTGENILAIGITMCCGFAFGFPIGAKLASDFYRNNLLSEKQATILSVTSNNFSPMYVGGFVLPALFSIENISENIFSKTFVSTTYILLYFIPLCFAAILLILDTMSHSAYKIQKTNFGTQKTTPIINFPNTDTLHSMEDKKFQFNLSLFDSSIINGFQTLIKLCGYIVLFSILVKITMILFQEPPFYFRVILENFEITNGIQLLANEKFSFKQTYILAIQILSFGGLSGIAQTNSVFADSGLSIYKYIIGKVTLSLLLTLLSIVYVLYFIHF